MIDMQGKRIGRWLVLRLSSEKSKGGVHIKWVCRCDCGVEKNVSGHAMRHGLSFGCQDCCNGLRPYEALYKTLVRAAKVRGLEVSLTLDEFVSLTAVEQCFYCGRKVEWQKRNRRKGKRPTNLDRKNNGLGYSLSNIVVCCGSCNLLRRNIFTHEQFIKVVQVLKAAKLWGIEPEEEQDERV